MVMVNAIRTRSSRKGTPSRSLRVPVHRRSSLKRTVTLRASSDAAEAEQKPPLNVPFELGNLVMRMSTSTLMLHNGIEKLSDPAGFEQFVVQAHLKFLPVIDAVPNAWTLLAGGTEIVCPILLFFGVPSVSRLSSFALFVTMSLAVVFHIDATGLEGVPFSVVENHQYAFECAALYALVFFYFTMAGPGRFSLSGGK